MQFASLQAQWQALIAACKDVASLEEALGPESIQHAIGHDSGLPATERMAELSATIAASTTRSHLPLSAWLRILDLMFYRVLNIFYLACILFWHVPQLRRLWTPLVPQRDCALPANLASRKTRGICCNVMMTTKLDHSGKWNFQFHTKPCI